MKKEAELSGVQNAVNKAQTIAEKLHLRKCKLINIRNYVEPNEDKIEKFNERYGGVGYGYGGGYGGSRENEKIIFPNKIEVNQSVIVTFKIDS